MSYTIEPVKKRKTRKKDTWDWGLDNMYPGLGQYKGLGKWPGLGKWKGFKGRDK